MSKNLTILLAGVVIGILISPEEGTKIRKRISDFFSDFLSEAEDKLDTNGLHLKGTSEKMESNFVD